MARIERIGGNYEVEELEFGLVYRWRPERFVVECDCGERMAEDHRRLAEEVAQGILLDETPASSRRS